MTAPSHRYRSTYRYDKLSSTPTMDFSFLAAFYQRFGASNPKLSMLVVTGIGAALFAGIWSTLAANYEAKRSAIERSEQARRAAEVAPASEAKKDNPTVLAMNPSSAEVAVPPDFLAITPEKILEVFKQDSHQTTAEIQQLIKLRYLGKRMRLTRGVDDVRQMGSGRWILSLVSPQSFVSISVWFRSEDGPRLTALSKGQIVEVEGTVDDVSPRFVTLEQGSLRSVTPLH